MLQGKSTTNQQVKIQDGGQRQNAIKSQTIMTFHFMLCQHCIGLIAI